MTEYDPEAKSSKRSAEKAAVVSLKAYQEGKEREEAMEQAARSLWKIRKTMEENFQVYLGHLEGIQAELTEYEEEERLVLVGEQTLEENPEATVSFMIQFSLEQHVIDIHLIFTPPGTLKRPQKIYSVINAWNQDYRFVAFFLDSDQDLVMRTSLDVEFHFEPKKLDEALILLSELANDCYSEIKGFWAE